MIIRVNDEDHGCRVDAFVSRECNISRAMAQKLIGANHVLVQNKICEKNCRLSAGDTVSVEIPEAVPLAVLPEPIALDIVYEDADLIVVNKPKGMVVHPAAGNETGTLVNALLFHCGSSLSGIGGVLRPGIVHRIDKDTSGMIVVAKNDRTHIALSEQLKTHTLHRVYHTIVLGNIKEDTGSVNAPIGRSLRDRKKMAVVAGGKPSVTHYRVLLRPEGFCYLECRLETGRTHQIRVHMAHIGHPILGDEVYGNGKNKFEMQNRSLLQGQCLHAKEIGFIHPATGEEMHFESPLPNYFQTILHKLAARAEKNL